MKIRMKKLVVFILTVVMLAGWFSVAEAAITLTAKIGEGASIYFDGKVKSTTLTLKVPAGTTKIDVNNAKSYTVTVSNSSGKN